MDKYFKKNGFTLIEVMITLAIFSLLIFFLAGTLSDIFTNSGQYLLSMGNIDQARAVTSAFTNEIRDAATGADGSYPLNQAGDSQIIFFTNFGANAGAAKRIRYFILNNILYKGVVVPTGSPLTYNLSLETISAVQNGVANGDDPLFYYYGSNYDGNENALTQPINVNQVRYIKINLEVLNQITKTDANAFSAVSGATIRSVKDNLGN